ncbi:MAG: 16S rRNA methyltransferase [Candidatus Lokiarchaeota archaeon]|nr:16S rRNA methyltransferase [Candidatus Lokiarchaeota archaeon]
MPLTIIFVECGLELIPFEIRKHPSIQKNLKKDSYPSKLLDNAIHHSAMVRLDDVEKRGRPDITHGCLLNALGSTANKSGNLKIYLHTIENKIFEINSDIKIARNYNRFKGLMAKLLMENKIGSDNLLLISKFKGTLRDLINSNNRKDVIILSNKGELAESPLLLFDHDLSKDYIVIIGCFQKGFFTDEILELSNRLVSISHYSLDAWVVLSRVITLYEIANDIL